MKWWKQLVHSSDLEVCIDLVANRIKWTMQSCHAISVRIVRCHNNSCQSRAKIEAQIDLHWTLIVTTLWANRNWQRHFNTLQIFSSISECRKNKMIPSLLLTPIGHISACEELERHDQVVYIRQHLKSNCFESTRKVSFEAIPWLERWKESL